MHQVIRQDNGLFGVIDNSEAMTIIDETTGAVEIRPAKVAWSMTEAEATKLAERLNLRTAWGI